MEAEKGMAMIEDGKTTATSCWIPSRPLKSSSPTKEYAWLKVGYGDQQY